MFENNDGPVEYRPWTEQVLDKFEEYEAQFSSARSYMSYIFFLTTGDVQKHLFPR